MSMMSIYSFKSNSSKTQFLNQHGQKLQEFCSSLGSQINDLLSAASYFADEPIDHPSIDIETFIGSQTVLEGFISQNSIKTQLYFTQTNASESDVVARIKSMQSDSKLQQTTMTIPNTIATFLTTGTNSTATTTSSSSSSSSSKDTIGIYTFKNAEAKSKFLAKHWKALDQEFCTDIENRSIKRVNPNHLIHTAEYLNASIAKSTSLTYEQFDVAVAIFAEFIRPHGIGSVETSEYFNLISVSAIDFRKMLSNAQSSSSSSSHLVESPTSSLVSTPTPTKSFGNDSTVGSMTQSVVTTHGTSFNQDSSGDRDLKPLYVAPSDVPNINNFMGPTIPDATSAPSSTSAVVATVPVSNNNNSLSSGSIVLPGVANGMPYYVTTTSSQILPSSASTSTLAMGIPVLLSTNSNGIFATTQQPIHQKQTTPDDYAKNDRDWRGQFFQAVNYSVNVDLIGISATYNNETKTCRIISLPLDSQLAKMQENQEKKDAVEILERCLSHIHLLSEQLDEKCKDVKDLSKYNPDAEFARKAAKLYVLRDIVKQILYNGFFEITAFIGRAINDIEGKDAEIRIQPSYEVGRVNHVLITSFISEQGDVKKNNDSGRGNGLYVPKKEIRNGITGQIFEDCEKLEHKYCSIVTMTF